MDDIKRLSSLAIALAMMIANMTAVTVSADDTGIEPEYTVTEAVSEVYTETTEAPAPVEETIPSEETTPVEEVTGVEEQPQDEPAQTIPEETLPEVAETEEQPVSEEAIVTEDTSVSESQEAPPSEPEVLLEEQIPEEIISGDSEASAINKGKGEIEGLVNTKVFQVTLPVAGNSLDYVADPQGLIRQTEAAKHPDTFYDPGANVYFNNGLINTEDGRQLTYFSGRSNPLVVVNKSSCAVSVVARVSAYYEQGVSNPVLIAGNREWENVTIPSIYLSVVRSDDQSEVVLGQREKVLTASIPGCPDAYRFVYEDNGNGEVEYQYRLMTDEELAAFRANEANAGIDTTFKEFSLSMTGECNSEGEWDSDLSYDFPSTAIVWSVGFASTAKPYINTVDYSVAYSSAIDIPYSLGTFESAATSIISAEYTAPDGEVIQLLGNDSYMSATEDTITLTSDFAYHAHIKDGGSICFRFNDPDETAIDVSLDNNAAPSLDETECTVSSDDKKITITYDLGVGNKAASGISSVTFGSSDFSASVYSSIGDGKIVLNTVAVRAIQLKHGGKVYVTFNDPAKTRCGIKINIE